MEVRVGTAPVAGRLTKVAEEEGLGAPTETVSWEQMVLPKRAETVVMVMFLKEERVQLQMAGQAVAVQMVEEEEAVDSTQEQVVLEALMELEEVVENHQWA